MTTEKIRAETTFGKTTRMAKEINEQEANIRQEKVARLRKARHEYEAEDVMKTIGAEPQPAKKQK